jgi:hypothetical protein
MSGFSLLVEWHLPDQVFAATFVRDGEPWHLDGALVGMGRSPELAVADLLGLADYLVLHGENFLTDGPIPLADRRWLFELLDQGNDTAAIQARYVAIRAAGVQA